MPSRRALLALLGKLVPLLLVAPAELRGTGRNTNPHRWTPTPTLLPTDTPTLLPTVTLVAIDTVTPTVTLLPTDTPTLIPTDIPTATVIPTDTTPTDTPTATDTPTFDPAGYLYGTLTFGNAAYGVA